MSERNGADAAAAEDWSEDWPQDRWIEEARKVRAALELLGDTELASRCLLPGEPGHSGQSVPEDYATWLALLAAKAQALIAIHTPDLAVGAKAVFDVRFQVLRREFVAQHLRT